MDEAPGQPVDTLDLRVEAAQRPARSSLDEFGKPVEEPVEVPAEAES